MAAYKIGDKVRIRDECKGGKIYDNLYFLFEMERHKGSVMTISKVYKSLNGDQDRYHIENGGSWSFNDAMLEPALANRKTFECSAEEMITASESFFDILL